MTSSRARSGTAVMVALMLTFACGGRQLYPTTDAAAAELTVRATGRAAIADDASSPAQGWVAAERAARLNGQRRLAEQVYGLLVRSKTTTRDGTLERDEIETKLSAFVQHAQVIATRRDPELGIVEVDLVLRLGPDYEEFILRDPTK